MKIRELCEKIKTNKIQNTDYKPHAVEDFLTENIKFTSYLPFTAKRELCAQVLEASCTKNGGLVEVDSVSRYILFTMSMITHYTDLTFENNEDLDSIDCYDLLCENNLLNPILNCIGGEYAVCNNMLNMMMGDIVANNNNAVTVLNEAATQLLDIVGDFADVLAEKVEALNLDLSKIDIDKLEGLLKRFKIMK